MSDASVNLRNAILNEVGTIAASVVEDRSVAVSLPVHNEFADRMLDAIRKALTSPEAVTAATAVIEGPVSPWPSARARIAITAALDAAMETGDE